MPALFTIYDKSGELFEVPAYRLIALKKAGWSTSTPVAEADVAKASTTALKFTKPTTKTDADEATTETAAADEKAK
jgi:hypothetical protein